MRQHPTWSCLRGVQWPVWLPASDEALKSVMHLLSPSHSALPRKDHEPPIELNASTMPLISPLNSSTRPQMPPEAGTSERNSGWNLEVAERSRSDELFYSAAGASPRARRRRPRPRPFPDPDPLSGAPSGFRVRVRLFSTSQSSRAFRTMKLLSARLATSSMLSTPCQHQIPSEMGGPSTESASAMLANRLAGTSTITQPSTWPTQTHLMR